MKVKIEIRKRNRDFGLFSWSYASDDEIKKLFQNKATIDIDFNGLLLRNRKVDYKYRRFSVGKKRIQQFANKGHFLLESEGALIKMTGI